jgi:CheY-like chemotaxis protein
MVMEQATTTETVLFVDDEQSILAAIRRGLFDEPYHCLFAQSGEEALALLETEPVAVLVTDMKMPKMD